jgi:hypothetical protein
VCNVGVIFSLMSLSLNFSVFENVLAILLLLPIISDLFVELIVFTL